MAVSYKKVLEATIDKDRRRKTRAKAGLPSPRLPKWGETVMSLQKSSKDLLRQLNCQIEDIVEICPEHE